MSKLTPSMIKALRHVAGEYIADAGQLPGRTFAALERRALIVTHANYQRDLTADGLKAYVALIAETGAPRCSGAWCKNEGAYRYALVRGKAMFACGPCSYNGTKTDGMGNITRIDPITAPAEAIEVEPVTTTTAQSLAVFAGIERALSAAARPVIVHDENGLDWHLFGADGKPVIAGEYTARDGDRFTIEAQPEVYFGLSVNEAPRVTEIQWQTIAGRPRRKRQSGMFGAHVELIMDGWHWRHGF